MRRRAVVAIAAIMLIAAAMTMAACGDGDDNALIVYNAQHEDLMKEMASAFTAETGIPVKLRSGEDFELANQLVEEGSGSPADVFVTENSPAMTLVDADGGFAKLDDATLAQVPSSFAPSDGDWIGFAARSTVLVYDTRKLSAGDLPASIMDLADPKWKGKIGIAAAGADFQAIVSAVVAVEGEAAASQWLEGLKANAKIYQNNVAVMKAANDGEIEAGVMYHYYWYKDQAESGDNSANTALHFFGGKDAGAFLSVSGAGVLKASSRQAEAQQFVRFLSGKDGQKVLADGEAFEYAVGKGAPSNAKLKPIAELDPPDVDIATLNGPQVVELMRQAGLL
jgi:iron(III) transport system substrate-binding protein